MPGVFRIRDVAKAGCADLSYVDVAPNKLWGVRRVLIAGDRCTAGGTAAV